MVGAVSVGGGGVAGVNAARLVEPVEAVRAERGQLLEGQLVGIGRVKALASPTDLSGRVLRQALAAFGPQNEHVLLRTERGERRVAVGADVDEPTIGRRFVGEVVGVIAAVDRRALDRVRLKCPRVRARHAIAARGAGQVEVVIVAAGRRRRRPAEHVIRAVNVHELRIGRQRPGILEGREAPAYQVGPVALPVAEDAAAGGVEQVEVAGESVLAVIADVDPVVTVLRPDDVVAQGQVMVSAGSPHAVGVRFIDRVVDDRRAVGPVVGESKGGVRMVVEQVVADVPGAARPRSAVKPERV